MNIKNSLWIIADSALSKMVRDDFDVYITPNDGDPTVIVLNFIELSKFQAFLKQDFYNFYAIYGHFCSDFMENFYPDMSIIFDKYKFNPNDEENRACMKTDIKQFIKDYETENNINLLEIFLQNYLKIK